VEGASAVSDNVRGVPDRHFGDAITQVIPARCGTPAGAIFAGSRAGSRGPLVNVLGGYVNMYWRSLNSSFGFHHKSSSSRKFRVSALIVLEFTSPYLSCCFLTVPFADCTHACPRCNQSSGPVVGPPLWCRRLNSRTHRLF
jgi:hypothetical protein